jgi:hypothetical protein
MLQPACSKRLRGGLVRRFAAGFLRRFHEGCVSGAACQGPGRHLSLERRERLQLRLDGELPGRSDGAQRLNPGGVRQFS